MEKIKLFLNQMFFTDMRSILEKGLKAPLQDSDLPMLPEDLKKAWSLEDGGLLQESCTLRKFQWNLLFLQKKYFSHQFWGVWFVYVAARLIPLGTPFLMHGFIQELEKGVPSLSRALFFAIVLALSGVLSGLLYQHGINYILQLKTKTILFLRKKIYQKILKIDFDEKSKIPLGDTQNHMSSDVEGMSDISTVSAEISSSFLLLFFGFLSMIYFLGWTSLPLFFLMLILVPLSKKAGSIFVKSHEELMSKRDERLSLISQMLQSIRLIKNFVWEKSIQNEVDVLRSQEMSLQWRLIKGDLLALLVYMAVSALLLFSALLIHSWRGIQLDAAFIFACVSLFNLLEEPLAQLSHNIWSISHLSVSSQRVYDFLRKKDKASFIQPFNVASALGVKDWSVIYPGASEFVLKNLNFHISQGEKVALVGAVGSGKSTLLLSLLEEIEAQGIGYMGQGNLAFVPQEAFLFNGSLRDNLLFGGHFKDAELLAILEKVDLFTDLEAWGAGLNTEIGEKGVNLSGGQKQRLSLARAFLQKPEILLLDDPFSAVDPHTEEKIVKELLCGNGEPCTVLMATHRLEYLFLFDKILWIENGKLKAFDSPEKIFHDNPEWNIFHAQLQESQGVKNANKLKGLKAEVNIEKTESVFKLEKNLDEKFNKKSEVISEVTSEVKTEGNSSEFSKSDGSLEGRITQEEERFLGRVKKDVYLTYVKKLCGEATTQRWMRFSLLFILAFAETLLPLIQKYWLSFFSNVQSGVLPRQVGILSNVLWDYAKNPHTGILIFGFWGLVSVLGVAFSHLYWRRRGLFAGQKMHSEMLQRLLKAPVSYYDAHPSGRLLQRFSRDQEAVDSQIPWSFEQSVKHLAQIIITLCFIAWNLPWVLLVMFPLMFLYAGFQKTFRYSSRELQRIYSLSLSPSYSHFRETLQGLLILRAHQKESWSEEVFREKNLRSERAFYAMTRANRWFSSRIPLVGGGISLGTLLLILWSVKNQQLSPGMGALVATYSLSFWLVLNWGVRIWSEVESRMVSVERILGTMEAPQGRSKVIISPILVTGLRGALLSLKIYGCAIKKRLPGF